MESWHEKPPEPVAIGSGDLQAEAVAEADIDFGRLFHETRNDLMGHCGVLRRGLRGPGTSDENRTLLVPAGLGTGEDTWIAASEGFQRPC